MTYSKQVMSISELAKETGISKTMLYAAAKHPLSYMYTMTTPGKGKILFDTAAFEKARKDVFR